VIYIIILSNKLTSNLMPDVAIPLIKPGVAPASLSGVLEALLTGDTASKAITALTTIQLRIAAKGNANSHLGVFKIVYLVTITFSAVGLFIVPFVCDIDHTDREED